MADTPLGIGLYKVGLFAACTDAQLRRLDAIVQRIAVTDGEVICQDGELADAFHVVLEGRAELMVGDATLQRYGPGQFFGEVAMLAGKPRFASARSIGDSVIGRIAAEDFEDLLIDMPVMARRLLHGLAERVWDGANSGGLEISAYGSSPDIPRQSS